MKRVITFFGVLSVVGVLPPPVLAASGENVHQTENRTLLTIPYEDREDFS